MFISTLLLIPWIVFGFRHPENKYLGLRQTRKSLLTLLIVEIAFFTLLILLLDKPDPNVAGQGSFAWMYMFFYEKGIFPLLTLTENFNPVSDAIIDKDYKWLYLLTALFMDYIILKLISPAIFNFRKQRNENDR
ncbi:hypothetical protein ACSVH2_00095 [Flavobacterium sp. RSB2_4_14]|uniref:hypothetical protein n=1 Tax=Flavobacterium sp. RSB2_4_14 TaxID=3447665 RepID=UPI003F34C572